ncbi:MAG TPA: hypothetical protein VNT58_02835 [Gaiellaceae bacterium]|nr:hypothetical protein [Gaiellaceae bacterium]
MTTRLEPISFGAFLILVPAVGETRRDERVVKPGRREGRSRG